MRTHRFVAPDGIFEEVAEGIMLKTGPYPYLTHALANRLLHPMELEQEAHRRHLLHVGMETRPSFRWDEPKTLPALPAPKKKEEPKRDHAAVGERWYRVVRSMLGTEEAKRIRETIEKEVLG